VLQKWGLKNLAELTNLDVLSVLVAAACHDYNHDGYKNEYHVNVISDNYHAAESFAILAQKDTNFLGKMSRGDLKTF
jgi:hypothetical protein